MIDELRMADDGCTNEPALSPVTEQEVRALLRLVEDLADGLADEYGYRGGGFDAVDWAVEGQVALKTYKRLRVIYPKESP